MIAKSGDQFTRVTDPILAYTQNLLEDSEFRGAFCTSLSQRMANRPLGCSTLLDTLRHAALESGPFTQVRALYTELPRQTSEFRLSHCTLTNPWCTDSFGEVGTTVCDVLQMAMASARHIANHPTWGKQRAGYVQQLMQPHRAAGAASSAPMQHALRQLRQVGPMHVPVQMNTISMGLNDTIPAFCFTA